MPATSSPCAAISFGATFFGVESNRTRLIVSVAPSSATRIPPSSIESMVPGGMGAPTTFNNLPAIRFLPDGTVDENSPQTLQLTESAGFSRRLIESRTRMGYEISNSKN